MNTPTTLAIVDFETTSLEPATGHVIEAAIALYSVPDATVIRVRSWLCSAPAEAVKETQHVHGIPPALVERRGVPFEEVAKQIHAIVTKEADLFASHNADFDRRWLPSHVQSARSWLCTCNDVDWPVQSSSRSLLAVAHAHGVQVGTLHRAADDVLLVARLFERVQRDGHDLAAMIAKAMRPKKLYRAIVSYDDRELAKRAGFRWQDAGKLWVKSFAVDDVPTLVLPFQIAEVTT